MGRACVVYFLTYHAAHLLDWGTDVDHCILIIFFIVFIFTWSLLIVNASVVTFISCKQLVLCVSRKGHC